ncbi:DUF1659 domain-containing protein [Lysinibacillus piscis]|uniref:DUF1659 domain-containing protein n=1 Tax=Lysinibacillus piscis TaxID=2518931 RepID=A0ABQ5NLY2_9BACI|nr:DUF1659 domain-containing protein [Lysinibacillus sp. KH24]GLC89309.1 hypothetical protein LYSBPC_24360 [Lysinibacillus sp. KH24]
MTNSTVLNTTLRLQYTVGYDEKNEPKYETKAYRQINATHRNEALVTVGNALATLSMYPLTQVVKQQTTVLS